MIDLNEFKQINDTYGHSAGDAALCEIARRLRSAARMSDLVARLGGDEFAMLLCPVSDSDALLSVVTRIEAALRGEFSYRGQTISLNASVGAAQYPQDGLSGLALLDIADHRMYGSRLKRNDNQT